MGLKKYEIITVGSDKRVRALRSWQVQDRYVNIGDVGGIVYDEKTLSQDGACWLFRGNFGFPGARIGGDSIVDVAETALSTLGTPIVDILGTSVVVGSKLQFASEQTAANAVVLTGADFEQGLFGTYAAGQPLVPVRSESYIRTKNPIFLGGKSLTVKAVVPGYNIGAVSVDSDGLVIASVAAVTSGEGVSLTIPAGQYAYIRLAKDSLAAIVPADATAAQITFTGTYETKLSIVDSRVEISPVTSTGTLTLQPGGFYTMAHGAKCPEAIIRNSKVSIIAPASRMLRFFGQIIESNATLDTTAGEVVIAGSYNNTKNLTASGVLPVIATISAYNIIQAHDCDNFAVSPTIFPGLAAAQTANAPFIFQGCNVPDGRFYHHAQIANTYKNIDFAKASVDLGKSNASGQVIVSSEVEGMYRVYSASGSVFGSLVEGYDSVKSLNMADTASAYGTTIYKDAYLSGLFDIAGTNVFGNTMKHEASNTQDIGELLVQGGFNSIVTGQILTGVTGSVTDIVSIPAPFRVTGSKGFTVQTPPTGLAVLVAFTDANNKIIATTSWVTVETPLTITQLQAAYAYLSVKRVDNTAITPDDVKGVTVTTYNGCKLVNTKETVATIAGNVRVEDNATLIDTSVTGTGYFGGNSIIQAPSDLVGQLPIEGAAYMSDNAVFAPSAVNATVGISLLEMKDNATFAGMVTISGAKPNITMADNAQFLGTLGSSGGFNMHSNSFVAAAGTVAPGCRGLLTLKDDARIESGDITAIGHITLCGKYKQTAAKTWTGKRVIGSQDAPTYDDNVKTQYDF